MRSTGPEDRSCPGALALPLDGGLPERATSRATAALPLNRCRAMIACGDRAPAQRAPSMSVLDRDICAPTRSAETAARGSWCWRVIATVCAWMGRTLWRLDYTLARHG
jgi:hypothetical protein